MTALCFSMKILTQMPMPYFLSLKVFPKHILDTIYHRTDMLFISAYMLKQHRFSVKLCQHIIDKNLNKSEWIHQTTLSWMMSRTCIFRYWWKAWQTRLASGEDFWWGGRRRVWDWGASILSVLWKWGARDIWRLGKTYKCKHDKIGKFS